MLDVTGLEDGFYYLCRSGNTQKCLVRLYTPYHPPVRGIGFGVWDGGEFLPLRDITGDSYLVRVHIEIPDQRGEPPGRRRGSTTV